MSLSMWACFLFVFSVGAKIPNRVDLRYLLVHVPVPHSDGQSTFIDQGAKEGINLTRHNRLSPKRSTAMRGDAAARAMAGQLRGTHDRFDISHAKL